MYTTSKERVTNEFLISFQTFYEPTEAFWINDL